MLIQGLDICFLNVGGLKSKNHDKTKDDIFLKSISAHDIILLAETHMGYNDSVSIEGYHYFQVCRPVSRNNRYFGGIAILSKISIKNGVKILPIKNTNFHWIQLKKDFFNLINDIFICTVYYPPSNSAYLSDDIDIFQLIEKDIFIYQNLGDIMLCGDFNARCGTENDFVSNDLDNFVPIDAYYIADSSKRRNSRDSKLDTRGKELLNFCIGNNLRILNGRMLGDSFGNFTCFNVHGQSVVDYVVASEEILRQVITFKVSSFNPMLSDTHCKLSFRVLASYVGLHSTYTCNSLRSMPQQYIWNSDSDNMFSTYFTNIDVSNKLVEFNRSCVNSDIDTCCSNFENIILSVADKTLRKPKVYSKKKTHHKWFDKDLHILRSRLLNKGKLMSKFPFDPGIKGSYFKLYREYNKMRKFKKRTFKQNILNQLDELQSSDPKAYWKLIDSLKENKNDSQSFIDPNIWENYFKALNSIPKKFNNKILYLQDLLKCLEHQSVTSFSSLDFKFSDKEISDAISKLKSNKSGGLQLISNNMVKSARNFILPSLKVLFNKILLSGIYPKNWAVGYISPIFKTGCREDPNNYRGITVTGCLGKLFNTILNTRLDKYLSENNLINNCQIGFCKNSRTSDHMFVVKCIIDYYFSKGSKVYSCFVDFQKAFDSVLHTAILIKLLKMDIHGLFYNIIKSMYSQSLLCVKVNNKVTNTFQSLVGVRQGDVLSPNLFKIFINDLPKYLLSSQDPIYLNNKRIDCLMYADDVILLSSSASGLQEKLNLLQAFCDDWCLSINIEKTKVLIFNKAGRLINAHRFVIFGNTLACTNSYKYLGILFSASGTFTHAKKQLYDKAVKALYSLKRNILSLNPSIHTSLHIFDHTIKPILLYGSEIWACTLSKKATVNDLFDHSKISKSFYSEKLHIHFCKYILGVHRKSSNFAVTSELARFPIQVNILLAALSYWHRLETTSSELLTDAFACSKTLHSNGLNTWFTSISNIIKLLNVSVTSEMLSDMSAESFKKFIKNIILDRFKIYWADFRASNTDGKLRTYFSFKDHFQFEEYLNIVKNFDKRRSLTKLRISAHKLKIEKGRFFKPPIPVENRVCDNCLSEIEDEIHFLIKCPKYDIYRNLFFSSVQKHCRNFSLLDDKSKFNWLITNSDKSIITELSNFIYESFAIHSS